MNIFVLDNNPVIAAQHMCDKHVVKMVLESAQMMCTIASAQGMNVQYKPTHKRHPCTLWAQVSKENWDWLLRHSFALCNEYTYRYGKTHKSEKVINDVAALSLTFPSVGLTNFVQAMPETYKQDNAVEAYRAYYVGEKSSFAKWNKGRNMPAWFRPVAQG